MVVLTDEENLSKKNFDLTFENFHQAQQRNVDHQNSNLHRQQALLTPDILRAHWIRLYKQHHRKK